MLLGPVVGAPVSEWQRMAELNVLGLLYCTTPRCRTCSRGRGQPRRVPTS